MLLLSLLDAVQLSQVSVVSSLLQVTGDFLWLGVLFFFLAIVAAVLGAQGVAGLTMSVAKWLIIIFIVLAIVSLLL